jgi:DNA polymerase
VTTTWAETESRIETRAGERACKGPPFLPLLFGGYAMPVLHRDIESKSVLNLKKVGARLYAAHPTTAPWCCAFAVDDGPIKRWLPGDPVPPEFIEAAQNPDWLVIAHNDAFETAIEELILAPQFNWPLVPIERHRCTMAMALASALPAGLDKLALAIELPVRKDAEGARLMRIMAKPRKPRAGEDPNAGPYWHDEPEKIEKLGAYCMRDVEVERMAFQRLPPLIDSEQELWALDAKINARGFYTDGALLNAASHIAAGADEATQRELVEITSGALFSTDQVEALQTWLGEHGCVVKDIRKGTLAHALRRKDLDPAVRRVIELRRGAAHSAAGKVDTLRAWREADGRVRGTLRFHGAGPGRWTGHGPQPQNFKRYGEDMEGKRGAIATGDLQHVAGLYDQPLEVVGDIARAMICAAPGHRLMIGDFSGVESRVTALVSGQASKLEQWAKFDATGDPKEEPYYLNGRACGLPEEIARDKGKVADLAYGFQGGTNAWNKLAPEDDASSEDDKKRYQRTWRNLNPETVRFWTTIARAAVRAVRKPGMTFTAKNLSLTYDGSMFLRITLPSGRSLSYPYPRLMKKMTPWGEEQTVVVFKDNSGGKWADNNHGQGAYGGLWTENIVQAISRDLLAAAMQRLEATGYPVVLHVHDEVICEVPVGFGSLDEFKRLLIELPAWADGLPIAAKSREGERFSKTCKPKPIEIEAQDALDGLLDQDDDDEDQNEGQDDETNEPTPTEPEPVLAAAEPDDLQLKPQQALRELNEETRAPPKSPPQGDGAAGNGQYQGNGRYAGDSAGPTGNGHGEQNTGSQAAFYIYQRADGVNYLGVKRTSTKQFPQFSWTGTAWVKGAPAGPKIPYRLPELIKAPLDAWVLICAGEKDAISAADLGFVATTNPEGERKGAWVPELNICGSLGASASRSWKTTTRPAMPTRSRWPANCAASWRKSALLASTSYLSIAISPIGSSWAMGAPICWRGSSRPSRIDPS